MSRPITEKQSEILRFLIDQTLERGYPPTIREIQAEFGLRSTRGVVDHLQALERKAFIRRRADRSRAIELLRYPDGRPFEGLAQERMESAYAVPLVGRIAAGAPVLAIENIEGQVAVDRGLFGEHNAFLLQVEGESMVDAHILDGDYILVRPQETAEQGEIVVAMVEDEATVKRFFKEGDFIKLVPENPSMEPILIRRDDGNVRVVGKVIGVFRKV